MQKSPSCFLHKYKVYNECKHTNVLTKNNQSLPDTALGLYLLLWRAVKASRHTTVLEGFHRSYFLLARRAKVIRPLPTIRHERNPANGPKDTQQRL
jgi:hypothetical protein